jgi:two-component system sensor kinase FixL
MTSLSIGLLGGITVWTATRLNSLNAIGRAEQALQESERRRLQSQAELLHVSRISELGIIGTTLAHELNQPLTAATNYISAGQRLVGAESPSASRDLKRALSQARASTFRATEIIRRLRAFVVGGSVDKEPQELNRIIEDALILCVASGVLQGVGTDFDFDRAARWVMVDPIQIQQVLTNLVRNAVDAMKDVDDPQITISTRRVSGGMAEIAFADNGAGFSDTSPDDLFSPFGSAKGSGMGLGLSICRTIIEAHGGHIRAENAASGAVFRFTLPLAATPADGLI